MSFTPLNALNSFIVVARRGSFAAAARELGLSPSALSQAVRQLEVKLGVTLLQRTARAVALTEAGQRLLEQTGSALDQVLDSLKSAAARSGEVTGRVRLTVPSVSLPLVMIRLIPEFVARHPLIALDVHAQNRMVDIVREGFDAGIRLSEAIDRDMIHLRVSGPGRYVVAGAPAYLARRGIPRSPKDLLEHECLCFRAGADEPLYAWEFERGRESWRIPVRGQVATNEPFLMRALAVAGVGLVYSLESQLAEEIRRGSLRVVLEPYAAAVPGFYLYYPSRTQASPAFRALLEVARELTSTPERTKG